MRKIHLHKDELWVFLINYIKIISHVKYRNIKIHLLIYSNGTSYIVKKKLIKNCFSNWSLWIYKKIWNHIHKVCINFYEYSEVSQCYLELSNQISSNHINKCGLGPQKRKGGLKLYKSLYPLIQEKRSVILLTLYMHYM